MNHDDVMDQTETLDHGDVMDQTETDGDRHCWISDADWGKQSDIMTWWKESEGVEGGKGVGVGGGGGLHIKQHIYSHVRSKEQRETDKESWWCNGWGERQGATMTQLIKRRQTGSQDDEMDHRETDDESRWEGDIIWRNMSEGDKQGDIVT